MPANSPSTVCEASWPEATSRQFHRTTSNRPSNGLSPVRTKHKEPSSPLRRPTNLLSPSGLGVLGLGAPIEFGARIQGRRGGDDEVGGRFQGFATTAVGVGRPLPGGCTGDRDFRTGPVDGGDPSSHRGFHLGREGAAPPHASVRPLEAPLGLQVSNAANGPMTLDVPVIERTS